ncbi:hypothetical protein [Melittangium boletus]|uniref:TM2 domain-containing protein n=1 Tax=Melittangium boletus DSM 14713 TaxID=1294270 RepID=A0A250IP59_9BACT|nr:hypothetical protein [Melittangium boletus]ATB33529.1 hypothetical protein MEBOL_007027 [Melittangium boletus DSM 14713]
MLVPVLLASLFAITPVESASAADPSISFAQTREGRHARLLEGMELAATFKPSETPALRLTDATRLGLMDAPMPLDTGGGVSGDTRPVLALVLGLIIGFGTGHLLAADTNGFILFLVVDVAIIIASSVLHYALGGIFWGLGGLALLASHVIQGIDAYQTAGGARIVEATRQRAILVADTSSGRNEPLVATRAFGFAF